MISTQNYAALVNRVLQNARSHSAAETTAANYLQNLNLDPNGLSQTQSVLLDLESGRIDSYLGSLKKVYGNANEVDSYFYNALAGEVLQGSGLAFGYADLLGHSVSVNSFIDPNDSYVQAYVKTLKENGFLKDSMTFDQKVLSIYNHVIQNFDYIRDQKDDWNFAGETIQAGKGDCEDLSVLLMSLIYAVGHEAGLSSNLLSQKIQGVTGNLRGFGEHVYLEYQTDDGQIYALDPSLRLEGVVQNFSQLKTNTSKRSEMDLYFTFNDQYTTVYGSGTSQEAMGKLYSPSSRIVSDHPGIQKDISNLFKDQYFLSNDSDDQRFLKLYNWFVSNYDLINEDSLKKPPVWAAFDLKAGNAKDLTFLFANYLLEMEKQSGTSDLDLANQYALVKIENNGESFYLLKVKDEAGSTHWVDFSQQIFPKQTNSFDYFQVSSVGQGLKISKTISAMSLLPEAKAGLMPGADYEFSLNDPLMTSAPKQSFASSFGLQGFVAQRDTTALSENDLKGLGNWNPYFHPAKHNNIAQPRIGSRVVYNDDGWEIPKPSFLPPDDAALASVTAQRNAAQALAGTSYYKAAEVFQKSAQVELAQMSDFNQYIISDPNAFGYLSVDQVAFSTRRQNLQRYLTVYQVVANLSQAMNASHGTVVEALGNGVEAYKQMDIKSLVSQETGNISRAGSEMLNDINNVVNARNQMLEAAFTKWINAAQKYVNNLNLGDILGLFTKQIALGVALVAACAAAFIGISAAFSTAFGLIAGFFTAPAGFALLAATIVGAAAAAAGLIYAVVKFGPAADIAPPKYATQINAVLATAGVAAVAGAVIASGLGVIPYAGAALTTTYLLSFIGGYLSVIMSAVQLSMEAVKLDTAVKTTAFNASIREAKLGIALRSEGLLDLSKQNKPTGSNNPLFEITESAYDAIPAANYDRNQKGRGVANGYMQSNPTRYLQALEQIDRKQNLFKAYVKVFQDKHSARNLVLQELGHRASGGPNQALAAIADQEFAMMKEHINAVYQLEQQYVAQHNKWKQAEYAENKLSHSYYAKLTAFGIGTALISVPVVGGPGIAMAVAATTAEWRNYYINDENNPAFEYYGPSYGNFSVNSKGVNQDLFSISNYVQGSSYIVGESDGSGNWLVDQDRVRLNRKALYETSNKIRALIMVKMHVSECRNLVHQEMTQNSGRRYGQGLMEIYDRERAFVEQMLNAKLDVVRTQVQTHNSENAQTQNFLRSNVQVLGALGLLAQAEIDNRSDLNIKLGPQYVGNTMEYVGGDIDRTIVRSGYKGLDFDINPQASGSGYDPFLTFADGRDSYYSSSTTTVTSDSENLTYLLFRINEYILGLNAYGAVSQSIREARRLIHQELTGIGGADTSELAKGVVSAQSRRLNQDFMSVVNMTQEIANLSTMYAAAKKEQSRNVIKAFVQGISVALSFVLLNINVAVSVGGLVSGLLDFIFATIDLFNNARWQNEINRRGRLNRFTAKPGQNKMEDKTQSQIKNLINAADEGEAAVAQADLKRMNKLKEQLAKLKQAGNSANVRGALGKATGRSGGLFSDAVAQEGSLIDNLGSVVQSNFSAKDQFNTSENSTIGKALNFLNTGIALGSSAVKFAKGVLSGSLKFNPAKSENLGSKLKNSFSLFGSDGTASEAFGGGSADSSSTVNGLNAAGFGKLGTGALLTAGLVMKILAKQISVGDFANDRASNSVTDFGANDSGSAAGRQINAVEKLKDGKYGGAEANKKLIDDIQNGRPSSQALTKDQLAAILGDKFRTADLTDPKVQKEIEAKGTAFAGTKGVFKIEDQKVTIVKPFETNGQTALRQLAYAELGLSIAKNATQLALSTADKNDSEKRLKEKEKSIERVIQKMVAAGVPLHSILEAIAYAIGEQQREFDRLTRLSEAQFNTVGNQFSNQATAKVDVNGKISLDFKFSEMGGIGALFTQGVNKLLDSEYVYDKIPESIKRSIRKEKFNEDEAKRIFGVLDQASIDRLEKIAPEKATVAKAARKDYLDYIDGSLKKKEFVKRMEQYFTQMGFAVISKSDPMLQFDNKDQRSEPGVKAVEKTARIEAEQKVKAAVPVVTDRQAAAETDKTKAGAQKQADQPVKGRDPKTISGMPAAAKTDKAGKADQKEGVDKTKETAAVPAEQKTAGTAKPISNFNEALAEFEAVTDIVSHAKGKMREAEQLYQKMNNAAMAEQSMGMQLRVLESDRASTNGILGEDITGFANMAEVAFGDKIVDELIAIKQPEDQKKFIEAYKELVNEQDLKDIISKYQGKVNGESLDIDGLRKEAAAVLKGEKFPEKAERKLTEALTKHIEKKGEKNIDVKSVTSNLVKELKEKTETIVETRANLRDLGTNTRKMGVELMQKESELRSMNLSLNDRLTTNVFIDKWTGWDEVGGNVQQARNFKRAAETAAGFGTIQYPLKGKTEAEKKLEIPRFPRNLQEHAEALRFQINNAISPTEKKLLQEKLIFTMIAQSYGDAANISPGFNVNTNSQDALIDNINNVLKTNHAILGDLSRSTSETSSRNVRTAGNQVDTTNPFKSLKQDLTAFISSVPENPAAANTMMNMIDAFQSEPPKSITGLGAQLDQLDQLKAPGNPNLTGKEIKEKLIAISQGNVGQVLLGKNEQQIKNLARSVGMEPEALKKLFTPEGKVSPEYKAQAAEVTKALAAIEIMTLMQMLEGGTIREGVREPVTPISWGQDRQSSTADSNIRKACEVAVKQKMGERFASHFDESRQMIAELNRAVTLGKPEETDKLIGDVAIAKDLKEIAELRKSELANQRASDEFTAGNRYQGSGKYYDNKQQEQKLERAQNNFSAEVTNKARQLGNKIEAQYQNTVLQLKQDITMAKISYNMAESKLTAFNEQFRKLGTVANPGPDSPKFVQYGDKIYLPSNPEHVQMAKDDLEKLKLEQKVLTRDRDAKKATLDEKQKQLDKTVNEEPSKVAHDDLKKAAAIAIGKTTTSNMTEWQQSLERKKEILISDTGARMVGVVSDGLRDKVSASEAKVAFESLVYDSLKRVDQESSALREKKNNDTSVEWTKIYNALENPADKTGMSHLDRLKQGSVVDGLIGKEDSRVKADNHFAKDTENPKLQAYHKLAAVTVFKEQNNIQTNPEISQKLLSGSAEKLIAAGSGKSNASKADAFEYNEQHKVLKEHNPKAKALNNFNQLWGISGDDKTKLVKTIPTGNGMMMIRYSSNIGGVDKLMNTESTVLSKMNKAYAANNTDKINQVRGALTVSERTVVIAFNPPPPVYVGDSTQLRMDTEESIAANEDYLRYVDNMKQEIKKLVADGVKPQLEIIGGIANMSADGKTTHKQHALSFARSSLVVGYLLDSKAEDAGKYMQDKHNSFAKDRKGLPVRDDAVKKMDKALGGNNAERLMNEFSTADSTPEAIYKNKEETVTIKVVSAGQSRNTVRLGEILAENPAVETFAGDAKDKLITSKVMEQIRRIDVTPPIQTRDFVITKNANGEFSVRAATKAETKNQGTDLKQNQMFLSRKESTDLLRTAYSSKDSAIDIGDGKEAERIVTAALKSDKERELAKSIKPAQAPVISDAPKPAVTPTAVNGTIPKTQS